jgi:hypothetical protein
MSPVPASPFERIIAAPSPIRRQHLGLVDVIDLERFQNLGLGEMTDPRLRHHRDRDCLLDLADRGRVGHPRHASVAPDVCRHALEGHHRTGAGLLGDLRLVGGDDVHDDAALEHLGKPGLDAESRFVAHPSTVYEAAERSGQQQTLLVYFRRKALMRSAYCSSSRE